MNDDRNVWRMLLSHAQAEIQTREKELNDLRLGRDTTAACIEVYHRHGQKHMSEYGAIDSLAEYDRKILIGQQALDSWLRAEQLLKEQIDGAATIVEAPKTLFIENDAAGIPIPDNFFK